MPTEPTTGTRAVADAHRAVIAARDVRDDAFFAYDATLTACTNANAAYNRALAACKTALAAYAAANDAVLVATLAYTEAVRADGALTTPSPE